MGLLKKFSKQLEYIKYPKQKTSWNIAGVIKGKNGFYRFDVRDMFKMPDGKMAQSGKTISKAEKMVFSIKDQWVIIDLEELPPVKIKLRVFFLFFFNFLIRKLDTFLFHCILLKHFTIISFYQIR